MKRYKVVTLKKDYHSGRCITPSIVWIMDTQVHESNNKVAVFYGSKAKEWAKEFCKTVNNNTQNVDENTIK